MRAPLGSMFVVLIAMVGAMPGCADILGADFDGLFPRAPVKDAGSRDDAQNDAAFREDVRSADGPSIDVSGRDTSAGPDDAPRDFGGSPDGFSEPSETGARDVVSEGPTSEGGWADTGGAEDGAAGDAGGPNDDGGDAHEDTSVDGPIVVGDASAADSSGGADGNREPEGGSPTGPRGGFVSLSAAGVTSSGLELRGQIVSTAVISGRTSTGISIEGRFQ